MSDSIKLRRLKEIRRKDLEKNLLDGYKMFMIKKLRPYFNELRENITNKLKDEGIENKMSPMLEKMCPELKEQGAR